MLRRAFLSAFAFVVGRTVLGADQSPEYWKAKVSAAVAMQSVETPKPFTKVEKPKASGKPIVRMYTATWCQPCQRAKAELKNAKLPFEIQYVDVGDGSNAPKWCESVPSFAWDHDGQTRYVIGFTSVSALVRRWETTNGTKSMRTTANNYQPRWTWPGDLSQHLQRAHGVNTRGMTPDEMESIHDAIHEGRVRF